VAFFLLLVFRAFRDFLLLVLRIFGFFWRVLTFDFRVFGELAPRFFALGFSLISGLFGRAYAPELLFFEFEIKWLKFILENCIVTRAAKYAMR